MENEFNWYTELDKAIKDEPDQDKYIELNKRASQWVTCACGQLCQNLPRDMHGEPEDEDLQYLGADFNVEIDQRNWKEAKAILDDIEARTNYLLNQLGS